MKAICWAIILIITIMPCNGTLNFEFSCTSNDPNNGSDTLITYGYVKEPRLSETGYTRGLKTGSFNYLVNGNIKQYKENYNYDYGNGTNISVAFASHDLLVDFNGEKGISEFYGKGFFGNNRAISAWKKIRYVDYYSNNSPYGVNYANRPVYGPYELAEERKANEIKVNANVAMDSNNSFYSYNFDYNANIKNGVFESKDSAGWSNRTGARRLDMEHESLISGDNFSITNILSDSGPFQVASVPIVDWLPCCISGTIPRIEGLDSGWPTAVVVRTLEADKLLPRFKQIMDCSKCIEAVRDNCSPKCLKNIKSCNTNDSNCLKDCSEDCLQRLENNSLIECPTTCTPEGDCITECTPKYVGEECAEGACPGYECIYTYDEDFPATRKTVRIVGQEKNINLTATYCGDKAVITTEFENGVTENATFTWYLIGLINNGEVALDDVRLIATLPKGMKFENSSYSSATGFVEIGATKEGIPELESQEPKKFDKNVETRLTWKIGTMNKGQQIYIRIGAFERLNATSDSSNLRTDVIGRAPDNSAVRMLLVRAQPEEESVCGPLSGKSLTLPEGPSLE